MTSGLRGISRFFVIISETWSAGRCQPAVHCIVLYSHPHNFHSATSIYLVAVLENRVDAGHVQEGVDGLFAGGATPRALSEISSYVS